MKYLSRGSDKIKIVLWLMVLLWMVIIFNLSSQVAEASNSLSKGMTAAIINTLKTIVPNIETDMRTLNHMIRKNAHFFAYFVLCFGILTALRRSRVEIYKAIIISVLICVVYAISDEVHQMFVPGRGPQVKDVFIDTGGACLGALIYLGLSKLKSSRKNKMISNE